ncbi:MAG: DUF3987 domain-containing protein [Acidimicrobiales bacterium]
MLADDSTYIEDARRMEAERIALGVPSYEDDLARVRALADPETMRVHSELSGLRAIEDDGEPLISLGSLSSSSGWPRCRPAVFHGPIGEFALAAAPFTEADPIAILAQALVAFGIAANSGPHQLAGNDRHPAALNVAIVAETAKGRKGTSKSAAFGLMSRVDKTFMETRQRAGFGSGEALVDALAGPKDEEHGDTRMLIVESELARALRVIGREGSTLGDIVRTMWDGSKLEARSRNNGVVLAENYHTGIIGHITTEELRSVLSAVEIYGGSANRFLWVCARRTHPMPNGGNVPAEIFERYAKPLRDNLREAYRRGRMERTSEADLFWDGIYETMWKDDPGGMLGAITARDSPTMLRLSLLYALVDGAKAIGIEHVEAGWALWRYCRGSAERIFGDRTGTSTQTVYSTPYVQLVNAVSTRHSSQRCSRTTRARTGSTRCGPNSQTGTSSPLSRCLRTAAPADPASSRTQ